MGIISEELPEHLQLKSEGSLSFPDWPSIYGTIWAGIKALYAMINETRTELSITKEQLNGNAYRAVYHKRTT